MQICVLPPPQPIVHDGNLLFHVRVCAPRRCLACMCVHACACRSFCTQMQNTLFVHHLQGFAYTKFPPAEVMSPSERRLLWFCDNETPLFNGIAMKKKKKRVQFVFCASHFLTLFCHVPKTVPIHSSPLPSVFGPSSHPAFPSPASTLLPFNRFLSRAHFCISVSALSVFSQI